MKPFVFVKPPSGVQIRISDMASSQEEPNGLMIQGKGLGTGEHLSRIRKPIRSTVSGVLAAGTIAATTVRAQSAKLGSIVNSMASDSFQIMIHDAAMTSSISSSAVDAAASQLSAASEYVSDKAAIAVQAVVRDSQLITNATAKLTAQSSQAISSALNNKFKKQISLMKEANSQRISNGDDRSLLRSHASIHPSPFIVTWDLELKSLRVGMVISEQHLCAKCFRHTPSITSSEDAVHFLLKGIRKAVGAQARISPSSAYDCEIPVEFFYQWGNLEISDKLQDLSVGTMICEAGSFDFKAFGRLTNAGDIISNNSDVVEKVVTIQIEKYEPILLWNEPKDIVFGSKITFADHLNAECLPIELPPPASPQHIDGMWSYEPPEGQLLAAGRHRLRATFAPLDSSNFVPEVHAYVSLRVLPYTPRLAWRFPSKVVFGEPLAFGEQGASCVEELEGVFEYDPPAGTVLRPAGVEHELVVSFTASDRVNYRPASASVVVFVEPFQISLKWSPPDPIEYGTLLGAAQLNAATCNASTEGAFVYDPPLGTLLPASESVKLSVRFDPVDGNYVGCVQSVELTVKKRKPVVEWRAPTGLIYGMELDKSSLCAVCVGDIKGDVSYSELCGTILPCGPHTITATFTPADLLNFEATSISVVVTVERKRLSLSWNKPDRIFYGTELTDLQLNAQCEDSVPGFFEYVPSFNTKLAVGVDQQLRVTYTPSDELNYLPVRKEVAITVEKAAVSIRWDPPESIPFGTELTSNQLNAFCSEGVEGEYHFSPPLGTVLPAGVHQLEVAFVPIDVANYQVATVSVPITVEKRIPKLTWNPEKSVVFGSPLLPSHLNAECTDEEVLGDFQYEPSLGFLPSSFADLDVTAVFTPLDEFNYEEVQVATTIKVDKITPIIYWDTPPVLTFGSKLSEELLHLRCGDVSGHFFFDPPLGTVLSAGLKQNWNVDFEPLNSDLYCPVGVSIQIDVEPKQLSVVWPAPVDIPFGTPLGEGQLNARCAEDVPGTMRYSPSAAAVFGEVGSYELSCVFAPDDTLNFLPGEGKVGIAVTKLLPVLSWCSPDCITYGTQLSESQLNAKCLSPVEGTFRYEPNHGDVLKAGVHELRVVFEPVDALNHYSASLSETLHVLKCQPEIVWNAPDNISFGEALDDSHLCARCPMDVSGVFEYSPPAGTVLAVGHDQLLQATFLPDDQDNYLEGIAEVKINVMEACRPSLSWPTPSPIVYGTALSSAQLNASCDGVDGDFEYTPSFGAVLEAGSQHELKVLFKPRDALKFTSARATTVLQVDRVPVSLSWDSPADIRAGTALSSLQLNAACSDAAVAGCFEYSPPAGSVLAARAQHALRVVFRPADERNYCAAAAAVTLAVVQPLAPRLAWPQPAAIPFGTELGAAQLNAECEDGVLGEFVYNYPIGTILPAGNKTVLVATFTPHDSIRFAVGVIRVALTVEKRRPTLRWAAAGPLSIHYGTALNGDILNAQCVESEVIGGQVLYSHPLGTILEPGTTAVSAVFRPEDSANYEEVSASLSVEVLPFQVAIEWTEALPCVVFGSSLDAQQLNATLSCLSADIDGQFEYEPCGGAVLDAGEHVICCTFVPSDSVRYAPSVAQNSVLVTPYPTKLAWKSPKDISYGESLNDEHLNAVVVDPLGLEGSFEYFPAVGELLFAGYHELSVIFTPKSKNYMSAESTVEVNVRKAPLAIRWTSPQPIVAKPSAVLTPMQLDATVESETTPGESIQGSFVYDPPLGSLIDFTSSSTVLSVRFEPDDCDNFDGCEGSVVLEFEKPPLILRSAVRTIEYGEDLTELLFQQVGGEGDPLLPADGHFEFGDLIGSRLCVGPAEVSLRYLSPQLQLFHQHCEVVFPLEVVPAESRIAWKPPGEIEFRTALSDEQLCATCDRSGAFRYAPPLGAVLSSGEHALTATFVPDEPHHFRSATLSVSLLVAKPDIRLKWHISDLAAGDLAEAKVFTAICEDAKLQPVDGTFTYSVAPNYVAIPGENVFVVTFYPTDTDNYSTVGKTLIVEVDNIVPKIVWGTPCDVIYRSTLTDVQLNARCLHGSEEVAGVFEYSPSLGAVLDAVGTHALSVQFAPNDYEVYDSVAACVSLEVLRASPAMALPEPELVAGSTVSKSLFRPSYSFLGEEVPGQCEFSFFNNQLAKGRTDAGDWEDFSIDAGLLEVRIRFRPDDDVHFNEVDSRVSLAVRPCQLRLTLEPPPTITYGTRLDQKLHMNAVCSRPGTAGSFRYDPPEGTVLASGSHALAVEFCPDDAANFVGALVSATITVDKATPAVEWDRGASIMFSSPISESVLDSFWLPTSVAGRFTYSTDLQALNRPWAEVGEHPVEALFTPADLDNYLVVRRSVLLKIVPYALLVECQSDRWAVEYRTAVSAEGLRGALRIQVFPEVAGAWSLVAGGEEEEEEEDSGQTLDLDVGSHAVRLLFRPADARNYRVAEMELTVEVTRKQCAVEWPLPEELEFGAALGERQLCARAVEAGSGAAVAGSLEYLPAAGSVLPAGEHRLQAAFSPRDGLRFGCAQQSTVLRVRPLAVGLAWQPPPEPLVYGTRLAACHLTAEWRPRSVAGTVRYAPFAAGALLPVGLHSVTATFLPADEENVLPASVTVVVEVTARRPLVDWPEALPPLVFGAALSDRQLCARCDETEGSFRYSCGEDALLEAGEHLLEVAFEPRDSLNYQAVVARASLSVLKKTPTLSWQLPPDVASQGLQFGATLTESELCARCSDWPPVAGRLDYSPPPGHSLSAVGRTTLRARFLPSDPRNFHSAEASVELAVSPATPVLSWPCCEPLQFGQGLPQSHLAAAASSFGRPVSGSLTYSHSEGALLEVGRHSLWADFAPLDSECFRPVRGGVSLEVRRRVPALQWRLLRPCLVFRTALTADEHLTALCASPRGLPGRFAYSHPEGAVLAPGPHRLTAVFTPADLSRFEAASVCVELTVLRIAPDLRWPTPRGIDFGRPLSALQLNAEAPQGVPGSLQYDPPLGRVLPGGVHVLRATFLPEDGHSYSPAEARVSLTVAPLAPQLLWDPLPLRSLPFGAPLTDRELDARTADPAIRGRFVYSPGPGPHRALLPVGRHSLAVEFLPDEPNNFSRATAAVPLEVTRTKPELLWDKQLRVIRFGTPLNTQEHLNARYADPLVTADFCYDKAVGEVLHTGRRRISLIARPHDRRSFLPDHRVVDVLVLRAEPVLTWPPPASLVVGSPLTSQELCARCEGLDRHSARLAEFVYSPPLGTLLGAGRHSLQVTVSLGEDFEQGRLCVPLTVERARPLLSWEAAPQHLSFGEPLSALRHLTARAHSPCAPSPGEALPGSFRYDPPADSVLGPGSHLLSVVFTPLNLRDFCEAALSVPLRVAAAAPLVTWPAPADLQYGQPLSELQLAASLADPSLSDLFAAEYDPPLGALLAPGTQSLSVVFRPLSGDQARNFTAARKTVRVTVSRIPTRVLWPGLPASIRSDAALSQDMLAARAEPPVPGRFEFSCDGHGDGNGNGNGNGNGVASSLVGRVLLPGTHSLRAAFLPDDPALYSPSELTLPLLVAKRDPQLDWQPSPGHKLFLGVPLTKQAAVCNAVCVSGIAGRFFYQVRETTKASKTSSSPSSPSSSSPPDSCVVLARFTPCEQSARYFNEASLTRSIAVGGNYADWAAHSLSLGGGGGGDVSSGEVGEPFLYSDDRVFTMFPYNDKHYIREKSPTRARRVQSATPGGGGRQRSRSPNSSSQQLVPSRVQSARKLP